MKARRIVLGLAGLTLAIVGWYFFRPERLLIDSHVSEAFPVAGRVEAATVLARGGFHGVAHEGTGTATIYRLPDGRRLLRFTEFETSNGPDLYVYLVAVADAHDSSTVQRAAFVNLGRLKGNIGEQNYELPEDVDLNVLGAVTIWCSRFGVNFATAPLAAP